MFFFTRYKNAPLATFISFISGFFLLGALYFSIGYFLGWGNLKAELSMVGSLAAAAVCAGIWFGLRTLAENMAVRKQKKMAGHAKPAVPAAKTQPEEEPEKPAVSPESLRASSAGVAVPSGTTARESVPVPASPTPAKKKYGVWIAVLLVLLAAGIGLFVLKGRSGTNEQSSASGQSSASEQPSASGWKKAEKAPEILNLTWNSQEQTVVITFRKNGLKGTFSYFDHYGRTTDEKHVSYGDEIEYSADDVITVSTKSGNFIPGEWQTFYIMMENEEEKTYARSEPIDIQIPINRSSGQRAVVNFSIQPIKFNSLKSLADGINAAYEKGYDEYEKYLKSHVDQVIQADVELTRNWLKVVFISPSGVVGVTSFYGRFSEQIARMFLQVIPVEKGQYLIRFYDWDNLCLADPDTYAFTVE